MIECHLLHDIHANEPSPSFHTKYNKTINFFLSFKSTAHPLSRAPRSRASSAREQGRGRAVHRGDDHVLRQFVCAGAGPGTVPVHGSRDAARWIVPDWWLGCFGFSVKGLGS